MTSKAVNKMIDNSYMTALSDGSTAPTPSYDSTTATVEAKVEEAPATVVALETGVSYMDSISGGRNGAMKRSSYAPNNASWKAVNGGTKEYDSYVPVIANGFTPAVVNSYSKSTIDIIKTATLKKTSYAPTKSSWFNNSVTV